MQCSHLILKPIPTDQMITTSPPLSSTTTTGSTYSSTGHYLGKGAGTQAQAAVICAPSNAPPVAAMPLDEDVSRLCRTSLKCLECSEMFLDENSLAMHYQQAPESSGQVCMCGYCVYVYKRVLCECFLTLLKLPLSILYFCESHLLCHHF